MSGLKIARENIGITADAVLRLGRSVGIDAAVWIDLRGRYDILAALSAVG